MGISIDGMQDYLPRGLSPTASLTIQWVEVHVKLEWIHEHLYCYYERKNALHKSSCQFFQAEN